MLKGRSVLAVRAIKTGPPALHDTPDARMTAVIPARLAFTAINLKAVLKITEFARDLCVIAQARSAGFDGLRKNGPH